MSKAALVRRLLQRWWMLHRTHEYRHYRRLFPLVPILAVVAIVCWAVVGGLALIFRSRSFMQEGGIGQDVVASFLVLPVGLTLAVLLGIFLQHHVLRFQARHAAYALGECVGLAVSGFIVFLNRDCGLAFDLGGPVDRKLVLRARQAVIELPPMADLPTDFECRLYSAIDEASACFSNNEYLRLAFSRAFDSMDRLRTLSTKIKKGTTSSSPENTALIFLHFSARMLRDLR